MRAVVQRVSEARVSVEQRITGEIGTGLLILLGVGAEDGEEEARALADRIVHLRIFPDEDGKMNVSGLDAGADLLVVSQFTLWGDCRQGRRPSFIKAAPPEQARQLYESFVGALTAHPLKIATGEFGAMMDVHLVNWGPVTLLLDTAGDF